MPTFNVSITETLSRLVSIERATDAIDSKSFLSSDWTSYTNAGATMEWLEREGFGLAL